MSSMNTPGNCWRPQSLTEVIETSTCESSGNPPRSTSNCCQPLELPLAAFHSPLDPVELHVPSASLNSW